MLKFFVSLFIVFSLLIAPLAHASGVACKDNGIGCVTKVEIKKELSKSEKQDDEKTQKSAHHCCCSHTCSDRLATNVSGLEPRISKIAIPSTDDTIASIAFGPPLEPPSHA